MPPSPVMRVSPGRELKLENHKRGRSLESGILYREKEDDLALFNEVRSKERDDFLLQSNDNFDDFFSTKLRHFSDYKLGISIPARGESSDLLNAERDKNDYDWLITPPETPLFRSLDDEAQPVKRAPRGRPRSQPVSISRSPTMEKDYRSGRGSASPHRLSPSPRSGNGTLQSRSRPFSATHSSPPPTVRHSSPARRLSPPPSKPTSAPRSSTPTPRRMSTGSTGTSAPSRVRGSSPIKTTQGNSTSPKIKAWQTNIPGFSSEVPPNLRTSLADRPASYVGGASPASRNSSRNGRQSMSPTASRSVASSHSHDRDPFSPYSKGSVASSGDDDVESPQSIPLSSSEQSAPRNMGAYPSSNAMSFSRKPTKKLSSSAPKRSFDLVRKSDRKGPHNMFRPLLSSVPSSTFHAAKMSAHHRSLISRNSSMTTSSNASSDHAAGGVRDTEGSELNQEDVMSDCMHGHYPDMDDEVFVMEHVDENDVPPIVVSSLDVGSSNRIEATTIAMDSPLLVLDRKRDYSDADGAPDTVTCSKCGLLFHSAEIIMEGDLQLCLECRCSEAHSTITDPPRIVMVGQNNTQDVVQIIHGSEEVLDQSASISECLQVTCTGQTRKNHLDTQNSYSDASQSLSVELFEEGELTLAGQKVIKQQLRQDGAKSSMRLDVSEGAGISLLLKRSSSAKGHIVQSRSFTASTTSYEDFSYVRDSVNSMRSSIERTSASVSSSIDLGSSRQTEVRSLWQSSGRKSDTENYRYEIPSKHKRSVSSVSSASGYINKELGEETCVDPHERSLASEFTEAESTCSDIECNVAFKTASELSSRSMNDHSGDTPVCSVLTSQEPASHENSDNLINNSHHLSNAETSSVHSPTSNQVYDATPDSCAGRLDVAEVHNPSSLNAISEIEIEDGDVAYYDSLSDVDSTNSKGCTNELQHHDAGAVAAAVEEFQISHHAHGVLEGSRILLEDLSRTKAKSLTLDEAADAILFCSSIVHNLAYEAANIAIDNEALQVEVLRPAITFVGKSNFERRDTCLRKRSSRSQKAQKKSLEMESTPSSCNAETNEKYSPRIVGHPDNGAPDDGDSMKPLKLESKCNCMIM
ncbi:hypothetical protein C2S51_014315 [Perilla frutescens var. frutescens]|nr:hypothetical protein C2S51_014315 [Perilla frutescens var. frutescens]